MLNEGKIVEMGNHKSLIESDGLYSSYFKSQEIANSVYDSRQQISKDEKEDNQNCENGLMLENHSPDSKLSKEISSYEIFMKLLPYNKPRGLILVLFVCWTAVASALPIMAIYLTKCLFAFLDRNHHHMKTETSKYWSVIAGMGALVLVLQAVSRYSLQILSFSMTKLVRKNLYKSMINQPIYFYDEKENSTGQLTGILASDSRVVNGASIELYILLYQGLVGITSGVIVGFIQEWNLGLVILGLLPATCFWAYFQLIVQNTPPPKASKYTDFERTIISDSISNYTTMLSLAYQDRYVERYYDWGMNQYHKMNLKVDLWQTHWFSVIYAASNAIIMGYVIPMIYVMSSNIEDGDDIRAQFIAMNAGILGSFSLSLAMFNAPDYGKGKTSSLKVFRMIESPQEGSPTSTTPNGSKNITSDEANGDIEFHNVWFKYPSSADWVLKNFSFKINGQESVGFVGESGCGKSTVTLLLLRFYEPNKGFVTIGGTRITEFTIKSLRSVFGLVQQEPIIFNCSIMENIWYGAPHATAQEIKKAAELANADNFIDSLTSNENPDNLR